MDVECRLGSSRTGSTGLDEEGHDVMRFGGEKVVTWLKVEMLLSSAKDVLLEMQDDDLNFLKECKMSLS